MTEARVSDPKQKTVKKTKTGVVVSDKMAKTVVVEVERRFLEPQFKKYISRKKKFFAQDSKKVCKVGDVVRIQETRPLSSKKCWKVIKVVKKGFGVEEVVV